MKKTSLPAKTEMTPADQKKALGMKMGKATETTETDDLLSTVAKLVCILESALGLDSKDDANGGGN